MSVSVASLHVRADTLDAVATACAAVGVQGTLMRPEAGWVSTVRDATALPVGQVAAHTWSLADQIGVPVVGFELRDSRVLQAWMADGDGLSVEIHSWPRHPVRPPRPKLRGIEHLVALCDPGATIGGVYDLVDDAGEDAEALLEELASYLGLAAERVFLDVPMAPAPEASLPTLLALLQQGDATGLRTALAAVPAGERTAVLDALEPMGTMLAQTATLSNVRTFPGVSAPDYGGCLAAVRQARLPD